MDDYDEKYAKIKFNSHDKLPLNKTIEIPSMITVVRAVFHQIVSTSFVRQMSIKIMNNIKMLSFDRIDVSEGIDVNKTSASKECEGLSLTKCMR